MQDARRAKKVLAVSTQLNALADRLEADGLQESNQQRRARIAYDYAVEAGRCLVEARNLGAFDREGSFVAKGRSFEPGRPSEQQEIATDVASLFKLALRDDRDEKANFNDVFCSLWRHWLPTKDDKFEYRRFQRPRLDLTYANYIRAFAEFVADLTPAKTAHGVKPPRRRRRSTPQPKPLTARQTEAMKHHGDCQGKIAEIARRMGVVRKTAAQHVKAAFTKLGKNVPTKAKTTSLKTDRRGQADVAKSDDHRG